MECLFIGFQVVRVFLSALLYMMNTQRCTPSADSTFMMTDHVSEEQLFRRFAQSGEQSAIEELIRRLHVPAYRVARCICRNQVLAEEAVQDAFLQIISKRNLFKERHPGSFRSWFFSVVTNSARMAMRSERRSDQRKKVDPDEFLRNKGLGQEDSPVVSKSEVRVHLERGLDALEERWRTPVVLHLMEGLHQREVASILGVSQQMVSRRIKKGVELLRISMGKAGFSISLAALTGMLSQEVLFMPSAGFESHLLTSASKPIPAKLSAQPEPSKNAPKWAMGTLAVVVVAVVAAAANSAFSPHPKDPGQISSAKNTTAASKERFWDFNEGVPKSLTLKNGKWAFEDKGKIDGTRALTAGEAELSFCLPEESFDEALVTFEAVFEDQTKTKGLGVNPYIQGNMEFQSQLFAAIESMGQSGIQRFEAYINKAKGFVALSVEGKPLTMVSLLNCEKGARMLGAKFSFHNASIDNLRIRAISPEAKARWEEALLHLKRYKIFKDFDQDQNWKYGNYSTLKAGPVTFAPGKGTGGGGALEAKAKPGKPVEYWVPTQTGRGVQVAVFDWFPLSEKAGRPEALSLSSHYFLYSSKNLRQAAARQLGQKVQAKLLPFQDEGYEPDQPRPVLAPHRWHKVGVCIGGGGCKYVVDGKFFSQWEFKKRFEDVAYLAFRFEEHGYLDNFRSYKSDDENEAVQALMDETRP